MDSTNRAGPIDLKKRAWCSLKKAIELNLYITETALWGTIIALKRVRALKRDMLKTSPTRMSAAYWANKELWSGPKGSKKSPPRSQKHTKDLNVDDCFD